MPQLALNYHLGSDTRHFSIALRLFGNTLRVLQKYLTTSPFRVMDGFNIREQLLVRLASLRGLAQQKQQ